MDHCLIDGCNRLREGQQPGKAQVHQGGKCERPPRRTSAIVMRKMPTLEKLGRPSASPLVNRAMPATSSIPERK